MPSITVKMVSLYLALICFATFTNVHSLGLSLPRVFSTLDNTVSGLVGDVASDNGLANQVLNGVSSSVPNVMSTLNDTVSGLGDNVASHNDMDLEEALFANNGEMSKLTYPRLQRSVDKMMDELSAKNCALKVNDVPNALDHPHFEALVSQLCGKCS